MSTFASAALVASISRVHECLLDNTTHDPRTACFTNDSIALNYGISILMSIVCFVLSVVTGNDSWVDRFWSIIPVVCAWVHTLFPQNGEFVAPTELTTRLLFTVVITVWGARLTYNFYRKGGYKAGGEDYRWNYVRTWPVVRHPAVWPFFSLIVISAFQVFLLVAIALPIAQLPNRRPVGTDFMFLIGQVIFLVFETAADQQQWEFQQLKQGKRSQTSLALLGDCDRGFLTHGLFGFSRHPNVVCEQLFWVNLFFASTVYAGFSITFLGAATLVLLTNFSTILTETLSGKKYPTYKVYQQTTPFLYPTPVSTRWEIDAAMSHSNLIIRGTKI